MLSSLFGDLVPRRLPATPASPTAPAVATDGGTALVRTPAVDSIDVVVDDSPTEAIRRLEVKDLPLIVANDCHGGDLYEEGKKAYARTA